MDVDGQGLERGHVHDPHRPLDVLAALVRRGRAASMATRKPARVLPEPVGAAMRVSVPEAMRGQPCS